ncbi:MAG: tRNA pseudouridine(55) synthase TruB [Deltaproteobacteria bacterium]|nr:tRNA pseudouridine(55) synthase TruB [Deltaproteobacteria bacterium]
MDGLLLIDKPTGPTSFDVVRAVRRAANERKVGHAGTLDPLASGLLVTCIGEGTKLVPFLMESEKRYLAKIALGAETDTDDALGIVTKEASIPTMSQTALSQILTKFTGCIQQTPPKYSALKSGGEPLYKKARRGEEVNPKAREVNIVSIDLIELTETGFAIDVRCGKGTYIRSLARDIARSIGTCGHLTALRRIETSGFNLEDALSMTELESTSKQNEIKKNLISPADSLPTLPRITLSQEDEERIRQGQSVSSTDSTQDGHVSLLSPEGHLCAVARLTQGRLQPVRVFLKK